MPNAQKSIRQQSLKINMTEIKIEKKVSTISPGEMSGSRHRRSLGNIFKRMLNLKNLNRLLLLIIIVGGIYYLIGINDLTVKGFKLYELKSRVNKLALENKDMELKITSLKSYNNLSERAKNISMVAVGDIDYITVIDEIVAKK